MSSWCMILQLLCNCPTPLFGFCLMLQLPFRVLATSILTKTPKDEVVGFFVCCLHCNHQIAGGMLTLGGLTLIPLQNLLYNSNSLYCENLWSIQTSYCQMINFFCFFFQSQVWRRDEVLQHAVTLKDGDLLTLPLLMADQSIPSDLNQNVRTCVLIPCAYILIPLVNETPQTAFSHCNNSSQGMPSIRRPGLTFFSSVLYL